MATMTVNGGSVTNATTQNNHGVAQNVGVSSTLSSRPLGDDVGYIAGSVVVDGNNTDKAVSAGTFAYNNQAPTAQRLANTAGGVADSALLNGADGSPNRSINKRESVITRQIATAIRNNQFNRSTGLWSVTPTEVDESSMVTSDVAANPSRSTPGSLTYKLGNPVAVTENYASKTN
jgi:hypothetical protein